MDSPHKKRVTQQFLDQLFNDDGWEDRLAKKQRIEYYNKPTPANRGQVSGTVTVGEKFYEAGKLVALVIYYRKPDGSLGASGKPSCKGLLIDGVWLYI